jgi:hypothetical protein
MQEDKRCEQNTLPRRKVTSILLKTRHYTTLLPSSLPPIVSFSFRKGRLVPVLEPGVLPMGGVRFLFAALPKWTPRFQCNHTVQECRLPVFCLRRPQAKKLGFPVGWTQPSSTEERKGTSLVLSTVKTGERLLPMSNAVPWTNDPTVPLALSFSIAVFLALIHRWVY